jgi:hypothetical protein
MKRPREGIIIEALAVVSKDTLRRVTGIGTTSASRLPGNQLHLLWTKRLELSRPGACIATD